MVVTTRQGATGYNPEATGADMKSVERFAGEVNDAVRLLAEILMADHMRPDFGTAKRYDDELRTVGMTLGVRAAREGLRRDPTLPNRNTPGAEKRTRFPLQLSMEGFDLDEIDDERRAQEWTRWNAAVDEALSLIHI